jgi:hypothetical protein
MYLVYTNTSCWLLAKLQIGYTITEKLDLSYTYCANFKSACHSVSCLLGKLGVYVNDESCLHKHLLLVVGQTANRLYSNSWSGHCVTIITVNEQTAHCLLFNPTVVLRYSHNDSYCVHWVSICVITCVV